MDPAVGETEVNQCVYCFKVLKHRYYLNRHIKVIHGGFRPHVCKCGKAFATREQFTRHNNAKHSDEKPYKCERGCERAFASYTARSYHYSAVHDQLKYQCPVPGCGKSYSAKVNLKNHLMKPHSFPTMIIKFYPW